MTYGLFEVNVPMGRRVVRKFPTYADAVAHAKVIYEIAVFAEDCGVDYPAADFLTKRGQQFTIEPTNAAQ